LIVRRGVLRSREYAGWRAEIDDDRADTGGFYLYLIGPERQGFDTWCETEADLRANLAPYDIDWAGGAWAPASDQVTD
jgi:hypothetical protein